MAGRLRRQHRPVAVSPPDIAGTDLAAGARAVPGQDYARRLGELAQRHARAEPCHPEELRHEQQGYPGLARPPGMTAPLRAGRPRRCGPGPPAALWARAVRSAAGPAACTAAGPQPPAMLAASGTCCCRTGRVEAAGPQKR